MKTKSPLFKDHLVELRLFGVLIALMVILSLISDRFLTVDNLTNVLWSVCLIGIMTTGAIYAPITGGIDLSVASMAALAGILANVFMNTLGMNWIVAIVLTLIIGAGIGWLNGVVTTKFLVPAFIVTMAAKTYLFGVAMLVSNGDQITIMQPAPFLQIGIGKFLGIPIPIYIMFALVIVSHILLKKTVFGRRAIAYPIHRMTLLAQAVLHAGADHRIVLDEQQTHSSSLKHLYDKPKPSGYRVFRMV